MEVRGSISKYYLLVYEFMNKFRVDCGELTLQDLVESSKFQILNAALLFLKLPQVQYDCD